MFCKISITNRRTEYALLRIDTCAVNSKGEKMLWVNAFCRKEKESFKCWEENLIIAADGGNCFYNVLFNVDKPGEPYKFLVKGNA
jgi:hypothetical protein